MLGLALGSTRRPHSQSLHQNNSGNTSWRSKSSSCTASLAVWLCEMHTCGPCSSSSAERHCCTGSRCRSHLHSRSQQQSSSADNTCFPARTPLRTAFPMACEGTHMCDLCSSSKDWLGCCSKWVLEFLPGWGKV